MNVIDYDFLNSLLKKQAPVKFTPATSSIQCANGSKMTVTGAATFSVHIGSVRAVQKFQVVKGLFPKLIVGIRTMKTMSLSLDPESDCAYVGRNYRVPFVSHVTPQSIPEMKAENLEGSLSGAKKSPQEEQRLM